MAPELSTATETCPVCGAGSKPIGSKQGQAILECPRCSLRFVPSHPHRAVSDLYSADYFTSADSEYGDYVGEEPAHRRQARRYLRNIAQVHAPGGTLLDVGGATGFFADEARTAGWDVTLVEVSSYAAEHARTAFSLNVVHGSFPEVELEKRQFDVVTFFNVFEHLENPRRAEARLRELVPPGGIVAIETWDWSSLAARTLGLEWHQYQPEYVPCYYSRKALLTLFDRHSWECVSYGAGTKWISVRRATDILAAKHGARILRMVGKSVLGSVDLPYRLGDLVWVVLKRAGQRAAAP